MNRDEEGVEGKAVDRGRGGDREESRPAGGRGNDLWSVLK